MKYSMHNYYLLFTLIFAMCCSTSLNAKVLTLSSPDGKNVVSVSAGNEILYSLKRNGDVILMPSKLNMEVEGEVWGLNAKLRKSKTKSISELVVFNVPRKEKQRQNNYNELTLTFDNYLVEFRAYNDGIAYRFVGTKDKVGRIENEKVEFNFEKNYTTYTLLTDKLQGWYEEDYSILPFDKLPKDKFSLDPVMIEVGNYKVLIAESNMFEYSGIYLKPTKNSFIGLFSNYPKKEDWFDGTSKIYVTDREDYIVQTNLKRNFPWRVIGIFDKATDIASSELIYMLQDKVLPNEDYSWIKPGKALWDWWNHNNIYGVDFKAGINTATYKYMIDFAAKYKIEYILIDEGWTDFDDILKLKPQVDIYAVTKYAKEKGVQVLVWAKWINIDKQFDDAFNLFQSLGVAGIKIDFMDRNDAKMVDFYERVAKKATEYKLLVDFHGSYPNDGLRRKYPNIITREGLVGLEYNKMQPNRTTVKHDLIIPYLRMWVGPMDYTPGAMLNSQGSCHYINQIEPMSMGTRCHQLAMYVVYESPLQMLSDSPTKYLENKLCLDFLSKVPTIWDKTVVLKGEIGENILIARKKDGKWFVGAMTGNAAFDLEIDFSFLEDGAWTMETYSDGLNAEVNGKDYSFNKEPISKKDKKKIHLASGGGFAAIITK